MASINQTAFYAFFNKPIRNGDGDITGTNEVFVELHATQSVSVNTSATVPDIPIRTGDTIADDLIRKPTIVNFTGRVTSFANSRIVGAPFIAEDGLGSDSDDAIVLLLNNMINEKVVANVVIRSPDSRVETFPRCILQSFSRSKTSATSNGWEVSLEFKQVLLVPQITSERVTIELQRPDEQFKTQQQFKALEGTSSTAPIRLTDPQNAVIKGEQPNIFDSIESVTGGG